MKICILTSSFPAYKGSTESIFVYEFARHLAKKSTVSVVCPVYKSSKLKKESFDNISVNRFQYFFPLRFQKLTEEGSIISNFKKSFIAKLQFPFFLFFMFLKGLKISKKSDIIHAQWALSGLVGVFIKMFIKKPLIITIRGSDLKYALKSSLFKRIIMFVFRRADYIIAVSEDLKKDIALLGIENNKISMIPNGIDTDLFKLRSKALIRKKLKLPLDKKIILFVGRLTKDKGISYLIQAFNKLDHSFLLLLIGFGPDKPFFRKITEKNNNITFLGEKEHDQVAEYMNASDVFILPSLSEGRPNVILEAMASGLPIIATNVGGIPEMMQGNKNGFLIKKSNVNDIITAVRKIFDNPSKTKKMKLSNLKKIKEGQSSWDNTCKKHIKIYNSLMQRS